MKHKHIFWQLKHILSHMIYYIIFASYKWNIYALNFVVSKVHNQNALGLMDFFFNNYVFSHSLFYILVPLSITSRSLITKVLYPFESIVGQCYISINSHILFKFHVIWLDASMLIIHRISVALTYHFFIQVCLMSIRHFHHYLSFFNGMSSKTILVCIK